MSCYNDIYNDLPLRCARLWVSMREAPVAQEFDVTFMLMTAAAGFAAPWEQFKFDPETAVVRGAGHPAFFGYDESRYKKSVAAVSKELSAFVSRSSLFSGAALDQWSYGHVPSIDKILEAVEMESLPKVDMNFIKARDIVRILRNALAHNNIYAFNRKLRDSGINDQRISELAFFSENKDDKSLLNGFNIVAIPVGDFRRFLDAWFALLKKVSAKQLRLVMSVALIDDGERFAA